MEPIKQIKSVADSYKQMVEARESAFEQSEYIEMLENTIRKIAQELEIEPEELIESVTIGRLNLSTLGASLKRLLGRGKKSTIGTKPMPGTITTSPYDTYVGEKETPRGDIPQGAIPTGLFKEPSGHSQVRRMTGRETEYDIAKRRSKGLDRKNLGVSQSHDGRQSHPEPEPNSEFRQYQKP